MKLYGSLILSMAVAGCAKLKLPYSFTPLSALTPQALSTGTGLCLCSCSWGNIETSIIVSLPSLHRKQPSSHLSSKDLSCLPSSVMKWKS